MKHLVLGGVKSGKSKFAEEVAESLLESSETPTVTLVVTAQALDQEMQSRIERHKSDRAENWLVIEEPHKLSCLLSEKLRKHKILVIDCLTLWLTNLLMLDDEAFLELELDRFLSAVEDFEGELILVSNETNMGVMPLGELSRRFCDLAGTLHKRLAIICDKVDLIVAGLPVTVKPKVDCRCK